MWEKRREGRKVEAGQDRQPWGGDGGVESFPCSERPTHGEGISRDGEGPLEDWGIGGECGHHLPCLFGPWQTCCAPRPELPPLRPPPVSQVPGLSPTHTKASSGHMSAGPEHPSSQPRSILAMWVLGPSPAPHQGLFQPCGSQAWALPLANPPLAATQILEAKVPPWQGLLWSHRSRQSECPLL